MFIYVCVCLGRKKFNESVHLHKEASLRVMKIAPDEKE
jgi:hypothetical protein